MSYGKVLTRAEEGDGGIYVVPALGRVGLERKIAPFGYYPQCSPNCLQVLFQTHFTAIGYSNRFYVAQLEGSAPSEVLAEFIAQNKPWAGSAAWYPDGKRGTVWVGDFSPRPSFWMVPIAGGPGIKLEIAPAVLTKLAEASTQGEPGEQLGDYPFSWSPSGVYANVGKQIKERRHVGLDFYDLLIEELKTPLEGVAGRMATVHR